MKNRFSLTVFVVFFPLIAHAVPSPPTSSLSLDAQQFVNKFWGQWSSPNSVALPYIQSVINDPVRFMGKTMSAREYMAVQTKFAARWPKRLYTPQPGSEQISCDQKQLTCRVDGIVNWQAWQSGKWAPKCSVGTANFTFILSARVQNNIASFRVSTLSSTVITRAVTKETSPTIMLTQSEADNLRTLVASDPATGQANQEHYQVQSPPSDDVVVQKLGCSAGDSAIIHQGCALITGFDLTSPFHTKDMWSFLVLQGPIIDGFGYFSFCFLKDTVATCTYSSQAYSENMPFDQNMFGGAALVYPNPDNQEPVLVEAGYDSPGIGITPVMFYIWSYSAIQRQFELKWTNTEGVSKMPPLSLLNSIPDSLIPSYSPTLP